MSSSSLCSSVDVGNDPDIDEILTDDLVSDIERFAEYINRLRSALDSSTHVPDGETMCVSVHAALSMVSQSVRDLLVRYPIFKTSQVLMPVSQLVHSVKEINFDSATVDASKTFSCIEKLEAAVGNTLRQSLTTKTNASRYSTATLGRKLNKQTSHVPRTSTNGTVHHRPPLTRRHSTFQPRTSLLCDSVDNTTPSLSHQADIDAEQMDLKLLCHDDGINLAFEQTKAWSKYCKDILTYVKSRIQMESEYAKKIQGLAEQSKLQMTENYVPLKEIYQKCFEADFSFSQDTFSTMKYLNERYIAPLEKRRTEHETCRRQLKNEWNKVTKQLQDCHTELKKSKTNLVNREVGYKKARDQFVRLETVQPASGSDLVRRKKEIEKRRRAEGDASIKKKEAEEQVRLLDAEMKKCREEVENAKVRIIAQLRELVYQCDQTTKACSDHYFQALANLWVRVPGKYQELSHETRTYTPGSEYMSFLQNLPGRSISSAGLLRSEKCVSDDDNQADGLSKCPSGSQRIRRNAINPDHQEMLPEASSVRRPKKISSEFKARIREQTSGTPTVYSEAAKSHTLQRIRQPTKCQQCDALSIWSTYQCRVCHQVFHKSCLARLKVNCGSTSKVLTDCARRMSIFGVPLKGHLDDQNRIVPLILEKCIDELQNRGMKVKGIYRTCGVKSKVEQICEHFEKSSRDADVDLSDIHPMNIASVVKLYLRKLPDPLMTFDLYPDWIKFAKRISSSEANAATFVHEMKEMTSRLPQQNFDTLKFLVFHLARVTWFEVDNLMTASNLAAVISPSLMWCHKTTATSNAYLEDAPLLTKTVEFIIKNAYEIFSTDRLTDFRNFFEKYPENEQPEAVDAETEAHIEQEAEIELGEDEDDEDYDLDEDEEQLCAVQQLTRRISAQPPTPDLLKNTRGNAENSTSFDLEYACSSRYSVGSSSCTDSSGPSNSHAHPQLEKRRSYTTSILVSPQADRRIPPLTHKQRSVDESAYTGSAVQSGDVTVEIGKGQCYMANSERRDRARAAYSVGSSKNNNKNESERVCLQSVGLVFSATDNDVSYV